MFVYMNKTRAKTSVRIQFSGVNNMLKLKIVFKVQFSWAIKVLT